MIRDIRAVAFDAYGTLCYIADRTRPFATLVDVAAAPLKRLCMTHPLNLSELMQGMNSSSSADPAAIAEKIRQEVASVRLFDDVLQTLETLRSRGIHLGVISNLASPYAQPVQTLLCDRIDTYIWSFEVGAIKPEPAIFEALCQRLEMPPNQVLMVGGAKLRHASPPSYPKCHSTDFPEYCLIGRCSRVDGK